MRYQIILRDKTIPITIEALDFGDAYYQATQFGDVSSIQNLTEGGTATMTVTPKPVPDVPTPDDARPYTALPPKSPVRVPVRRTVPAPLPTAPLTLPREPGEKRTQKDLRLLESSLLAHIQAHPGQRVEEINAALGLTTAEVRLPMTHLVESGAVSTLGERRGMRYFAGVVVKNLDNVAAEFGCARSSVERYVRLGKVDGYGERVLMTPRSISYLGRFHDRKNRVRSMREALTDGFTDY